MIANWQKYFDLTSKISFVLAGFALPVSATLLSILVPITIVSVLLSGNLWHRYQFITKNYLALAVLTLFTLYLMGAIYSTAPLHDIFHGLFKYSKLLLIPLFLPICQDKKWRNAAINAFLLAIIITLLVGIIEWIRAYHDFTHIVVTGGGVFHNHIETGLIIAFAAFILVHRALDTTQLRLRIAYIILLLISLFFLFFIDTSRTGYLVSIALIILLALQKFKWKGLIAITIGIPIFISSLFMFSNTFHNSVKTAVQESINFVHKTVIYTSIGDRLDFASNSIHLIKKSPIVGTGTGSFKKEYADIAPLPPAFAAKGLNDPHNEYFMTTVQLGLVGLFFLLLMFAVEWKMSFVLPFFEQYLAQGLVVSIVCASFCDSMLYYSAPGYLFVYFSALLFSVTVTLDSE
jgi:O-antigen ligase